MRCRLTRPPRPSARCSPRSTADLTRGQRPPARRFANSDQNTVKLHILFRDIVPAVVMVSVFTRKCSVIACMLRSRRCSGLSA